MLEYTVNAEYLLSIEVIIQSICILSLFTWVIYDRLPIKEFLLICGVIFFVVGAFRPENYNSDTLNYASYVRYLTSELSNNVFTLTKIEPLHVVIIVLTQNFRLWLIVECVICCLLLYLIYIKTKRIELFTITLAFSLSLYTSSTRFCVAILLISYLFTIKNRSTLYLFIVTMLSGAAHVVALVSGLFGTRARIIPFIFVIIFYLASIYYPSISERTGPGIYDFKSIGLKSFIVLVTIQIYVQYIVMDKKILFALDLLGTILMFLLTALYFPTLNRVLILCGIIIMFDTETIAIKKNNITTRIFCNLVFSMIIIPYIYLVPQLFVEGRW